MFSNKYFESVWQSCISHKIAKFENSQKFVSYNFPVFSPKINEPNYCESATKLRKKKGPAESFKLA